MKFDCIVIGGGHAGIEAASVVSAKNLSVLLITNQLDLIGQMSCNPSIGGVAKGNIVREIDALGGLMGRLIDECGIHFKMLNKSKGAAVWGNRAQADKVMYRRMARNSLEKRASICLLQGMVKTVGCDGDRVESVSLESGEKIFGRTVINATGTFLNGIIHIGLNSWSAGRHGEPSSTHLTECLNNLGIKSGRLKTGTSPRIDGRSVDFSKMTMQSGDEEPWPFSFSTIAALSNKVCCWIARTNDVTHSIIKDNLHKSPLYTGKIKSIGPRYCPSIEDKVVRFGDRDGHALFLEPESIDHNEMYLNGLSSSLPFDVQLKMVRSVKGLENARIIRPAYGIEYDYFFPQQLYATLESRIVRNLYFAGQINGTSGYEEAAGQGLIAGMNAALRVTGEPELVLGRDQAYIGVLIDDLVAKGTEEPYRMFTSRAEHRLILRQDNCDERLMPIAYERGFIGKCLFEQRKKAWDIKSKMIEKLRESSVFPQEWNEHSTETIEQPCKMYELVKRPSIKLEEVLKLGKIACESDRFIVLSTEWDIKYCGFVQKQKDLIEKIKKLEEAKIPESIDYNQVPGLLTESKMKLKVIRPQTLGQASRISGVTPSDITILALFLTKVSKVSRETIGQVYE